MPKVSEMRLIDVPRKQVYKILMDITLYPEFIPFVQKVRVVEQEGTVTVADLKIGFGPIGFSYRCRIEETPFEEINIRDVSGPFEHLEARLTFTEKGKGLTLVGYYFSSQFRSGTMNAIADPLFETRLKSTLRGVERYIEKQKK